MKKEIKKGNLNFDQSGRAYPDNPQVKENWDYIWDSISNAEKQLKIFNITAVCKGNQETAGGYKWKYKTKENQ